MHKGYLKTAALLGALSVLLGAFAAHGLRKMVEEHTVASFETGVRYQFYHVFALAMVAILYKDISNQLIVRAGLFFIIGIFFFSGSLYLLTIKVAMGISGLNWLGPITPIGGLFFIVGWLCLFMGIGGKLAAK